MIKIFNRKPTPSAIASVGEMVVNLSKMMVELAEIVTNYSKSHSDGLKALNDLIVSHVIQEHHSIRVLDRIEARIEAIEKQMIALAKEQALLSNRVENTCGRSLRENNPPERHQKCQ